MMLYRKYPLSICESNELKFKVSKIIRLQRQYCNLQRWYGQFLDKLYDCLLSLELHAIENAFAYERKEKKTIQLYMCTLYMYVYNIHCICITIYDSIEFEYDCILIVVRASAFAGVRMHVKHSTKLQTNIMRITMLSIAIMRWWHRKITV